MSPFEQFSRLRADLTQAVVGQHDLIERLLIALLADGHLLVEGAPGLAKTRAVKALADRIEGNFQRIQFTPDLLPADITGTEIYLPSSGEFRFQPGPLFGQIILADEINRAPAKVQSALLEAMAERQISAGQKSYPLPELFLVMATQNPLEQDGTYRLPEAQLDRFLMHTIVSYPAADSEAGILALVRTEKRRELVERKSPGELSASNTNKPVQIDVDTIRQARIALYDLFMSAQVENYLLRLTHNTRASAFDTLKGKVAYGASPRGTIALDLCARAHAWLQGRDYVSPANIQAVAHDVLRHRLVLTYESQAQGLSSDNVIDQLLDTVAIP